MFEILWCRPCPSVGAVQIYLFHLLLVLYPRLACPLSVTQGFSKINGAFTRLEKPARLYSLCIFFLLVKGDATPVSWRGRGHRPLELTFIPAKNLPSPLVFLHRLVSAFQAWLNIASRQQLPF